MGPNARALLSRVTSAPLESTAFPFGAIRPIAIGYATAFACRRTYVGELGFELTVPTEFAAAVYDRLMEAGGDLGLRDTGYYALEGLRLEKGYRAWGRELTPDRTPYEAGLGFAVKLDKEADFIGRAALEELRRKPPRRRCVSLVAVAADAPMAHGGELVMVSGRPVGEVTSAAFGAALGRVVMLAYLDTRGEPIDESWLSRQQLEVDIAGEAIGVTASLKSPYDPANLRVRS
jgi:4-methylaminobutanoate oxidase (formaldehyde-forming)